MRRMDFEENGCVLHEDFAVGARGDIFRGGQCVENYAGALETSGADALEGKQGVVDAAEAVCDDEHDGQGEAGCEVGDGLGGRDGDEPSTGAFDKDRRVFFREGMEPVLKRVEREGAILKPGGDERGGGFAEPDGVGFVEG